MHGTSVWAAPAQGWPPGRSLTLSPFQAFELATGDYLFEPHSGEDYSRDEGRGRQALGSASGSPGRPASSQPPVYSQTTSPTSWSCWETCPLPLPSRAAIPGSSSTGEVGPSGLRPPGCRGRGRDLGL